MMWRLWSDLVPHPAFPNQVALSSCLREASDSSATVGSVGNGLRNRAHNCEEANKAHPSWLGFARLLQQLPHLVQRLFWCLCLRRQVQVARVKQGCSTV